MAVEKDALFYADDFTSIKATLKQEMQRRGKTEGSAQGQSKGSLSAYAGSNYDYTVTPVTETDILAEHLNKITDPLNAARGSSLTHAEKDITEIEASQLNDALSELAALTTAPDTAGSTSASGCHASCSGLCYIGCYSACSSCTGSCSTTCTGGCQNGCQNTCLNS